MSLFDAFSPDDAQQAAMDQKAAIARGQGQAGDLLNTGLGTSTGQYTQGISPFLQNYGTASQGQQAYANAVGAGGPAGTQAALSGFQGSPGYQYALDQATQNYMRNQASTGALGGGGTLAGITALGSNLGNQNWGQYVNNLLPFLNASNAAAGGIQTGYNAMAGNTGQNFGQQASLAYGGNVAQGNAQAAYDIAPQQASQNLWNFGLNAAQAIASIGAKAAGAPGK